MTHREAGEYHSKKSPVKAAKHRRRRLGLDKVFFCCDTPILSPCSVSPGTVLFDTLFSLAITASALACNAITSGHVNELMKNTAREKTDEGRKVISEIAFRVR